MQVGVFYIKNSMENLIHTMKQNNLSVVINS